MEKLSINKEKDPVEDIKAKLQVQIENAFDKKDSISKLIDDNLKRIEFYKQFGLDIDINKIAEGFEQAIKIEDKNLFVSFLLKLLDPIIIFRATQPQLIEKADREFVMSDFNNIGRIRLSETMYCGINEKNGSVHIHLAPAKDFINKEKIKDFYSDIENGFKKLAEIVKSDERILKITATSWIVSKSEDRIKDLGFTIEGGISDEIKKKYFNNENRPVSNAFISRDDFLKRYGN